MFHPRTGELIGETIISEAETPCTYTFVLEWLEFTGVPHINDLLHIRGKRLIVSTIRGSCAKTHLPCVSARCKIFSILSTSCLFCYYTISILDCAKPVDLQNTGFEFLPRTPWVELGLGNQPLGSHHRVEAWMHTTSFA